jgi:hypothetical protein
MVYRYGLILAGDAVASATQIDAMINAAVLVCEKFYPAFQLVCWSGQDAEEAMSVAINEAYGRA